MTDERAPLLALVRRYGWNATSFQALDDGFRCWFADDDAGVAYTDTGAAWVAAGAPVTDPQRFASVSAAFVRAARAARRRACFFATERRFIERTPLGATRIGEQPTWDPAAWEAILGGAATLRSQLRRARAKGVVARAVAPAGLAEPDSAARRAVDRLVARWLATRRLAPMGFLVEAERVNVSEHARYFVAERGASLVGFAVAVPIFARAGWMLQHLLRDPEAPNGTSELLVDAVMSAAAGEGVRLATMGLAPLSGPLHPALRVARRVGAGLFDFEGLRSFKAKFRPDKWDPIYLSYPTSARSSTAGAALAIYDTLTAFARGGLLRFGMQSVRRTVPGSRATPAAPVWTPALPRRAGGLSGALGQGGLVWETT